MAIARTVNPGPLWICTSAFALALAFALAGGGKALAQTAPAAPPATAQVFTINELLAKHESGRPRTAGKTASVERADTASDAAPARRGAGPEPFGLYAFKAPEGQLWTKWRAIEADLAAEAKEIEICRADAARCTAAAKRFVAIVGELTAREGRPRLETANRLMNGAIKYVSDLQQHGQPDRWTAPLATLAAREGDCEDFAIAKYAALRDAGVPESDMRLVLVRDTKFKLDHAVLAVRHEGEWMILDNRRPFVTLIGDLGHYMPLFALDRDGVKLFAAPYAAWGEGSGDYADWKLRGSDGAEFAAWSLRGSDAEPAAAAAR